MIELTQRNRKLRKMCMSSAKIVEYDEDYTNELCPNCYHELENNCEYLFTLGRKNKWEIVICYNCNQIIRKKP